MHTLSAGELRHRFVQGDLSAVDIANHFLHRIHSIDPKIGAFLRTLDKRVLEKAHALDTKKSRGESLGTLAGIPIAVKDNIHIKGELTTCASKFLTNYVAPFDATVTQLLEEQDALLIGKTNLDEFAMGSSTENSALQTTRNPWNLACIPGGSSGGSAAAVAARLCPLALGSDTGGSVRFPAALCGTVGFKPTYGRVSRYGLVAYGSSLDQIGPLAMSSRDIALIMETLGRHCQKDSTSLPLPPDPFLQQLDKGIKGQTIGVPWNLLEELNTEARVHFDANIAKLKELGAKIATVDLSLIKSSIAVYYILATAEASTNLARFDGIRYGQRSTRAKTLDEVYDFSKEEGFGAEVKRRILLGTYVLSAGYQDAYYRQAQKVRTLMIRQFNAAYTHCNLIAMPVAIGPAFPIGAITDPLQMYLQDLFTIPANLTGMPAVSVPSGFTADGKPLALQLIGPQKSDPQVLRAAHAFETAVKATQTLPEVAR